MANDLRPDDPEFVNVEAAREALRIECAERSRNTVYTSASFYIWAKQLKFARLLLWTGAVVAGGLSARASILDDNGHGYLVAAGALLAVILPGLVKALGLDEAIAKCDEAAAKFKIAEGRLRLASKVSAHLPFREFRKDADAAIADLEAAQKMSVTPPNWCFRIAQRRVKRGDYDPDPVI